MKYLEILERNEWEGESWSFFIPYDDTVTKDILKSLKSFLLPTDSFELVVYDLTRETVDFLLNRNEVENTTYMRRYNLKDEYILNRASVALLMSSSHDAVREQWYKGSIYFNLKKYFCHRHFPPLQNHEEYWSNLKKKNTSYKSELD